MLISAGNPKDMRMRLNHLDLHVPDVARTVAVLTEHFGLHQEFARDGLVVLRDDTSLELVISEPVPGFGTTDQLSIGAATYHIGFIVDAPEMVDDIYVRLGSADVQLARPPRAIRGGWLFYCTIPGGIQVEVGCRSIPA